MHRPLRLERDTERLDREEFDLLIVGAGIFGAAAAWDAALRGYKVALVEQNDFGSGVSANSYKIVHGGIRYLQHLDIARVRSSCHERSTLLKIAPHLVHPLPIAMPTYGYGMSGKPVLTAGTVLYDAITADRNRGIGDPSRRVPASRRLSKTKTLELFPGLETRGLTGSVLFHDAQLYNPPRLALAFLQAAAAKGASLCNHAKVESFEISGGRVSAAQVHDRLTGDTIRIRAKAYLNAAGPWTDALLETNEDIRGATPGVYSRDACFVVPRKFSHDIAVAIMGQTKDPDAVMTREGRSLFVVPWREFSLIGTWHKVVPPRPDEIGVDRSEVEEFIAEMHAAYPALGLSTDEVTMCNWGLVPFGEEQHGGENLSYGKRSVLIDHAESDGPGNLVSLVGIRYTMGRGDSEWAMNLIARKLGDDRRAPGSDGFPLYGGEIPDMSALEGRVRSLLPASVGDAAVYSVARSYGSEAPDFIRASDEKSLRTLESSHVLEAQIRHAVRYEMAMTLGDAVFRRTDLASGGNCSDALLRSCAEIMREELGLTAAETDAQLGAVRRRIPGW